MVSIHISPHAHRRGAYVGVFAVLMLAALPLLAASTLSAPAAQGLQPTIYLPLVLAPPPYDIAYFSFLNEKERIEIFKMNADGSNQVQLTNNPAIWPGGGQLAWSPDGRQIAFSAGLGVHDEIFVMNADGSHQTDLSNSPAEDWNPIWSPDGLQIAFNSYRDGSEQIYVMNADGSNLTRLTNNLQEDRPLVLSPDWRRVAFTVIDTCDIEFCSYDIYTMNVDGSGRTNLTPGPGDDYDPVWSPDGRQIAFTSGSHPLSDSSLYVIDADGSNKTMLGTGRRFDREREHVWSPDGRQIAFVTDTGRPSSIYVVNADGSGLTKLSSSGSNPAWSPDGRQIAFDGSIDDGASLYPAGIYVMNADGSHQTRLSDNSEDRGPVWSPPLH